MNFIPLTLEKTRRTFHVRAKSIVAFVEHVNDDEKLRCTKVFVDMYGLHEGVKVLEAPDEIIQLIQGLSPSAASNQDYPLP